MPRRTSAPDIAQALSLESVDKRIDILRRIAQVGSISEAARGAGVSYKAAWQAVETLSNLAGAPMLAKAVGGAGGGGAVLTTAGQQVLDGAHRLAQARARALAQWQREAAMPHIGSGLAALGLRTSMRNHLPCTVQGRRVVAGSVQIRLDLGQGIQLLARITRESEQLLGLTKGLSVLALCKATAIQIAASWPEEGDANVLPGVVTRIGRSGPGGEVSMQLASGQQLVGFTQDRRGLRPGQPCMARVDPAAVVIGLFDR
jgi:molybdate transport system regulatory protein